MKSREQSAAINDAVNLMASLPFFPVGDGPRSALMREMEMFCSIDPAQIRWLGRKVANSYKQWPGILTLRAVWCTRYKPADGVEASLGTEDPVGAAIQGNAEARPYAQDFQQVTGAELKQIAGITDESAAEYEWDLDVMRYQSQRWQAVLRKLPKLTQLEQFRQFENSTDVEKREEILVKAERAARLTPPPRRFSHEAL